MRTYRFGERTYCGRIIAGISSNSTEDIVYCDRIMIMSIRFHPFGLDIAEMRLTFFHTVEFAAPARVRLGANFGDEADNDEADNDDDDVPCTASVSH